MAKYTAKRVVMALLTLLVVACITFFLMNAIPGNPWLSEKTPSQATIDALNAKYGLDQPLIVQLGKYLGNLLQGDFGVSIKMQKNRPVLDIILEMFPVSAKVGIVAICWAVVVGVPLGGQPFAGGVHHRHLNAGLRGGDDPAAYAVRRDRGAQDFPDDL